jgi:hypothetical protein
MSGGGPVYVAGLERSGTSLMFALLASHPNLAMTRRTNLWRHFYGQFGDLTSPHDLDRCLETMRRYKRLVGLGTDWDRLRADLLAGPVSYPRLFALLEQQYADRLGRPRWGDKSLHTERYARQIVAADPGAKILHMIRDPRDRFASSYARWTVRRGGVGAGTAEWLSSARLALRNERAFPANCRAVRYESLATDPEGTLAALCAFIGEAYDPAMLAMEGAPTLRDGGNSSYGRLEPGTISTSSIGRFTQVLSPRQIAYMQARCAAEMATFGYTPAAVDLPVAERLSYAFRDVPVESAHLLLWRARESLRDRTGRPLRADRLVTEEEVAA